MKTVRVDDQIRGMSESLHDKVQGKFNEMLAEDIKRICTEVCGEPNEVVWKAAAKLMADNGYHFIFEPMQITSGSGPGKWSRVIGNESLDNYRGRVEVQQAIWFGLNEFKISQEQFQQAFRVACMVVHRELGNAKETKQLG